MILILLVLQGVAGLNPVRDTNKKSLLKLTFILDRLQVLAITFDGEEYVSSHETRNDLSVLYSRVLGS